MAGRTGHIMYTWLIILIGFGILARLFSALDLDLGREFLIMIALGMLADWLAVSFPQGRLSGGFSVVLASYLTYGPAAAAWISALAALFGQGIVNRGNPLRTTLFNASQYVLALLFGHYVFGRAGGHRGADFGLGDLLPLLAFIAVYFLANHLFVYLYLLPGRRRWLYYSGITFLEGPAGTAGRISGSAICFPCWLLSPFIFLPTIYLFTFTFYPGGAATPFWPGPTPFAGMPSLIFSAPLSAC